MKFLYARVSSLSQNLDRQLTDLPGDINRIFEDKASGKNTDRPGLTALMGILRAGDVVYCHSLDRLARNTRDLLNIVRDITDRGATIEFRKEHLTFAPRDDNAIGHLMLHILGAIAEFERSLIRERQLQGIAIAKAKGRFKGGKRKLAPDAVAELRALVESRTMPIAQIARKFGISRVSVYSYARAG
ncbi:MAG: recombinase family protein [Muribaculaceae bacterium]|nr:recombinase family protein [Muribaculaceae bacterium]